MTKMLSAAVALIAALALTPAAFGAACADCEPGGGGGGGPTNNAPTAAFGFAPSVAQIGGSIQFTSSSTDSDGSVTGYSWSFGDGRTSTAASPSLSYGAAGTYTVTLTVTDNDGAASQPVSHQLRVNAVPTATILVDQTTVEEDTEVSFNSLATDPDGFVSNSAWNFDDGGNASGATASHTWTEPGTYDVTYTVTDNDGAAFTQHQLITVTQHPAPDPDPDTGGGDTGGSSNDGGGDTGGGSNTGGDQSNGGGSNTGGGSIAGSDSGTPPLPTTTNTDTNTNGGVVQSSVDRIAPALVVPAKLKARKKAGKLAYTVSINEAATIVAKLKGKVAGTAKVKITKAGKGKIVIKLSSKAKKALKAAKNVKLTLTTTATDAAGNTTTKTTKVSLV